jgi:hypothetical protein
LEYAGAAGALITATVQDAIAPGYKGIVERKLRNINAFKNGG